MLRRDPHHARLKETKVELSRQRTLTASKDLQLQSDTAKLLQAVNLRHREAELAAELECAGAQHDEELQAQELQLKEHHQSELVSKLMQAEEDERKTLHEQALLAETASVRLLRDPMAFDAEVKEETRSQEEEMKMSRLQMAAIREELLSAHDHVRSWRQERDGEAEAASVAHEAYLAESRASLRQHESLRAEARTRLSEVASLEDFQRSLDAETKVLQNELGKVAYSIGQRDHELKIKDSELQEVRSSLVGIQDEMDEVNTQLKVQCQRVQRVEREVSLSSDLGEKVKNMRHMLQESHSGIAQLCNLINQERQKHDQYLQGLKQQRLRTELLLQLLHHFKNRTQELAPRSILGGGDFSGVDVPQEPMTPDPRMHG
ncbi:unnamed protein product [Durusdinium trenchii]|uniref:Uncharacterized protein n=2 Tax=Durusdinium trenchii TaxID=1381693 RepID=A0ABP0QVL7_9DINO